MSTPSHTNATHQNAGTSAPPLRVGIIGGGQLGLMLAESLAQFDTLISILDPDPCAPAARAASMRARSSRTGGADLVATTHFVAAPFDDKDALLEFVSKQDVVTYDWESIDADTLRTAAAAVGAKVIPDLSILEMTRSRLAERRFIESLDLPCAPYAAAASLEEVRQGLRNLGLPVVVKTDRGGYDGKGQWVLASDGDLERAAPALEGHFARGGKVILERRIELLAEVSCIVARNTTTTVTFPVFDNTHRNQILWTTEVPSRLPSETTELARSIALQCATAARLEGLLTVEFFVGKQPGESLPRLLINEFAPRPHNSGHVTRRATTFSQFDALARCLLDLPLVAPRLLTLPDGSRYRMTNIMGEDILALQGRKNFAQQVLDTEGDRLLEYFDYGKRDVRAGRKMGHYIAVTDGT